MCKIRIGSRWDALRLSSWFNLSVQNMQNEIAKQTDTKLLHYLINNPKTITNVQHHSVRTSFGTLSSTTEIFIGLTKSFHYLPVNHILINSNVWDKSAAGDYAMNRTVNGTCWTQEHVYLIGRRVCETRSRSFSWNRKECTSTCRVGKLLAYACNKHASQSLSVVHTQRTKT